MVVKQQNANINVLNFPAFAAKNPPMPIDDNAKGSVLSRIADIHAFNLLPDNFLKNKLIQTVSFQYDFRIKSNFILTPMPLNVSNFSFPLCCCLLYKITIPGSFN
jgi:hypothetical protein